ncbi:malonate--CoA ligase [Benzoatithermus flavus]|uniref:Malonyl-CoA synthase n=1 Tax=Benzoatithermus flavus TaxID=3108223 RepID=A0ABU8XMJ6_9PROT
MQQSFFALIQSRYPVDRGRVVIETGDGRTISYAELDAATARYARVLRAAGAEPGDRVAFHVEKSPQALFLYLASLRAGLVALPMNPAYQAGEVGYMLGNAEPAIFVTDPARIPELQPVAVQTGVKTVLTLDAAGQGSLPARAEAEPADFEPVPRGSDDLAAMLYTSGTTGRPKGAPLSHGNLASNAQVLVEAWGFGDQDVLLHALPIFHAHGLFVACHCTLLAGAAMLWLPRFDVQRVMELLPRATVMMGVPTFYTRLLDQPDFGPAQAAHVRLFVSGSAPLLAETHRAFERRTGQRILERYGMSEILMHTSNPLHGERRPGSVGRPLPGSQVRIVDEADRECKPGEVGAVLVKGPNVFKGYWRAPEKNEEEFTADGWFRTGDLGLMSEDGYLTLVGRAKDLVITGGLNVYPSEVEAVIDELPGVVESAVVGLPHPDLGEAVTAVIKPKPGAAPDEAAVIAACKAQLAGFKVPKRVLFTDELPRNAMGKVQKNLLRQAHAGLYAGKA